MYIQVNLSPTGIELGTFHNILRPLEVLPNFSFTTSETNDARLLLINMVYTSCIKICQTT